MAISSGPGLLRGLTRHKVFVSYHHANDQWDREKFETLFSTYYGVMISKSVQIGDINPFLSTDSIRQKIRDEYLRDSTVTVVLVGKETWKRKHVDWEIASSIRQTKLNSRSGLVGIFCLITPIMAEINTNLILSLQGFIIMPNVAMPLFMIGQMIRIKFTIG